MPPLFHNLTPETRCTPSAAYDTGAVERQAFDQFAARLEQTAQEYINDVQASDSVNRASRARRGLIALLEQVDGYIKQQVSLN